METRDENALHIGETKFRFALGQAIIDARKRRGMSQGDLAAKAGVQQSMLSRWERGGTSPKQGYLVLICRALDIETWALLGPAYDALEESL